MSLQPSWQESKSMYDAVLDFRGWLLFGAKLCVDKGSIWKSFVLRTCIS
jgi:hypothetical protein